jgi:hypothetical protein
MTSMDTVSFENSTIVFATHHRKSIAAHEPFMTALNSRIEELLIDSDRLGTFSGEIERRGTMIDALRDKVALARTDTSERFVLVSEGSFGSADGFGVLARGIEMLMLHDAVTGVEVLEQYVSWDTNYATATISQLEELERFLQKMQFGTHALVVYPEGNLAAATVRKGIVTRPKAQSAFSEARTASPMGRVVVLSDMRAHCNPTRMKAISTCCALLANRLATRCPRCGSGGFGMVTSIPGLPCQSCGAPTQRSKLEEHGCVRCGERLERRRSDGVQYADPSDCGICNP